MSKYAGEFFEDDDDAGFKDFGEAHRSRQRSEKKVRRQSKQNEVGVCPDPPPETVERRQIIRNDYVLMHKELFPNSTGLKPFGADQIESTRFDQDVFQKGGRLLKLEPRAFAKTTRLTNEALGATLEGDQHFIVIVASALKKANDILGAIRTELTTSNTLFELYPRVCACFQHLNRKPQKSRYQTYGGDFTYIQLTEDSIHFPSIPGEPSSGAIIKVRPMTNLKGLNYKIESGPNQGKVLRPSLYIFDDPQTSDDAKSETSINTLINKIRRDALKGGSHQRPVSAIMAITPMCYGDLAYHFEFNETSWDIVKYKMVKKFPTSEAHEMWLGPYSNIRKNFDRTVRGSREAAYKKAKEYVLENWETLHEGSEVAWEYAFSTEEGSHEVSALQHAYNIIIDDGMEDFEYEYQCNTEYGMYDEDVTMHATKATILSRVTSLPRKSVRQWSQKIVTHIDVNKDVFTYLTLAAGNPFRATVIDYGSYPSQTGRWSKNNLGRTLRTLYPSQPDFREVLYLAAKDLFEIIAKERYAREDGVLLGNNMIGIDARYEESFILRACRETHYANIVIPCYGTYVGPDDDPLHLRNYTDGTTVYDNCIETGSKDRTLQVLQYDTNALKTDVHKGFNMPAGAMSSITLFEPEYEDHHVLLAEHCNAERPELVPGKKSLRTKVQWYEKGTFRVDNEYFDNLVGCLGLMRREGIEINEIEVEVSESKKNDIRSFIEGQKGRSLL